MAHRTANSQVIMAFYVFVFRNVMQGVFCVFFWSWVCLTADSIPWYNVERTGDESGEVPHGWSETRRRHATS